MDKEVKIVKKADELTGWRRAYLEEIPVIQGILLDIAVGEKRAARMTNVYAVIFIYACAVGAMECINYLKIPISENDIFTTIIFCLIILVLLVVLWNFVKILYVNVIKRPMKLYADAVKKGTFRVLDIEIEERLNRQAVRGNLDGHYVKVKDLQGVLCEEALRIRFANSYNGKSAILIEVVADIPVKYKDKTIRKIVLPKKEISQSTWEKGLQLYSKYIK